MSVNLFNNNNNKPLTGPLFPQTVPQQSQPAPQSQPATQSQQPLLNPTSSPLLAQNRPQIPTNTQQPTQRLPQHPNPPPPSPKPAHPFNFKQVYKQIQLMPQKMKSKLQKSPQMRRILSQSLQYFDKSTKKSQQYQNQHIKKQNYGFGVQQMREQCKNVRSQKIDYFWKMLVETVSQVCNVSQLVIVQYLSEYLCEQPIYLKKLTIRQFYYGRYVCSPNNAFIDSLFMLSSQPNQKKVCLQSEFFLGLFQQLVTQLYSQYIAMLRIIQFLQKNSKRYFRQIIKKQSCDFFTVLWKKYKYFSQSGIKKDIYGQTQNQARQTRVKQFFVESKRYGIEAKIRRQKVNVAMHIANVLQKVIEEYGSWKKMPILSTLIDGNQAMKFIDADLEVLVKQRSQNPVKQYKYIKCSLQLLLKIFPICSLCKKPQCHPSSISVRQTELLRATISQTKSTYLQPFRFLAWFTNPSRHPSRSTLKPQLVQRWQRIPKNIQLLMRSSNWGQWVSILLGSCDSAEDIEQCEELLAQIVKILKMYVEENIQQFWEQGIYYQYQFIKKFMVAWIHEKGVKLFLPVLTKCLGNQGKVLQYAKKTLDLIGFDGIKRIRDSLMQTLQLSDKHNSSLKFSMFNSYPSPSLNSHLSSQQPTRNQASGIYPQQQLKFLCRISQQTKQNLSLLQSTLFECQPQYSTGILVCKFLLECLSKLREFKPSCIKCMRYVMEAIDVLFQSQVTRDVLIVAISGCYLEQGGQNYRQQLLDMVGFVCLSQSISQQYRQAQKLRTVISRHINNIARLSRYISEYFPQKQDIQNQPQYLLLNTHIQNKNHPAIFDWLSSPPSTPKATPYFISLCLCLQSQRLLPMDFETIRLLMIKMMVYDDESWDQEYVCLRALVDILNGSQAVSIAVGCLQPCFNMARDDSGERIFLYNLTNLKYKELMEYSQRAKKQTLLYNEDECYFKIKQKQKQTFKYSKQMLVGNIAGAIELITTVLKLRNRIDEQIRYDGMTDRESRERKKTVWWGLVTNLKIYVDICKYFVDKDTIYHYKVQLPIQPTLPSLMPNPTLFPQPLTPPPPSPPSQTKVNIIKVLCSYLSFEHRYNISSMGPHMNKPKPRQTTTLTHMFPVEMYSRVRNSSMSFLDDQNLQIIQDCMLGNVLLMPQDQLGLRDDFSIGVGSVLRALMEIVKRDHVLFQRCLTYQNLQQILQWGLYTPTQSTSSPITQLYTSLTSLFTHTQSPSHISLLLQFLTLTLSKSPSITQQLIHNNILQQIRKNIIPHFTKYQTQKQLDKNNKLGLFLLALAQYKDKYWEDVIGFGRLPTGLLGDLLAYLGAIREGFLRRERELRGEPVEALLACFMQYYRKYAFCILYKGTIHIALELFKIYYLDQSVVQVTSMLESINRLVPIILQKPPKVQYNYGTFFKQRHTNPFLLYPPSASSSSPSSICQVIPQLHHLHSSSYPFLSKFIQFLPCLNVQYGYSYQYYGCDIYVKNLYARQLQKKKAQKIILSVYKCGYQSSLLDCHEGLMLGFMAVVGMVEGMGKGGQMLVFGSRGRENEIGYGESGRVDQLMNQFKYVSKSQIQNNPMYPQQLQQTFTTKQQLITSLTNYLQQNHQKQYINDAILYTISVMLYNMQSSLHKLSIQYVNKYTRLIQYLHTRTRISLSITGGVYAVFLAMLVRGYLVNVQRYEQRQNGHECQGREEQLVAVCQCLEDIVLCNVASGLRNESQGFKTIPANQPFTPKSLHHSISILTLPLIHLLSTPSPILTPTRRTCLSLILSLTSTLLQKYLSFTQQSHLNNIVICKLINTILTQTWHQVNDVQGMQSSIIGIASMYLRKLAVGLRRGQVEVRCFVLQGMMVLHGFGMDYDVSCCNGIMDIVGQQFSHQDTINKYSKIDTNQYENTPRLNIQKTQPKLRNTPTPPFLTLPTLLTSSFVVTLQKILHLNQTLSLLHSITCSNLYWTNQKYSTTVQNIFNTIINQQFLYQLTDVYTSNGNNRILQCRINGLNGWESVLEKVCAEERDVRQYEGYGVEYGYENRSKGRREYGENRRDRDNQAKKTSLFQFCVHVQVCNSVFYYSEIMAQCLEKSQCLKNFYSRLLNNRTNFIDENIWDKISNSFIAIIEYMRQKCLNFIRFYPRSLRKLLPLYIQLLENPDINYSSSFLNTFLSTSSLSSSQSLPQLSTSYRNHITEICLSLSSTIIQFIQIWKSNDWKQNTQSNHNNYVHNYNVNNYSRNRLLTQFGVFYRDWNSYIADQKYIEGEKDRVDQIAEWFMKNQKIVYK